MIRSEKQKDIFKSYKNEPNSSNSSSKIFISTKINKDKLPKTMNL